jgi:hypothetical protein
MIAVERSGILGHAIDYQNSFLAMQAYLFTINRDSYELRELRALDCTPLLRHA